MNNYSLIPEIFKKTLEPLRGIEKSISHLWNRTPSISYVEEGVYLPNIEIHEFDNEYHVSATIPGVEGKDVRIEYTKGTLVLKGEKKTELEEDRSNFHISERSSVNFNHSVRLPDDIDENNISATLQNGVIEIVLSKLEESDHKSPNDQEETDK
jgi:HSP20 family protein